MSSLFNSETLVVSNMHINNNSNSNSNSSSNIIVENRDLINNNSSNINNDNSNKPKLTKIKCPIHLSVCRRISALSGPGKILIKCKEISCNFSKWFDSEEDILNQKLLQRNQQPLHPQQILPPQQNQQQQLHLHQQIPSPQSHQQIQHNTNNNGINKIASPQKQHQHFNNNNSSNSGNNNIIQQKPNNSPTKKLLFQYHLPKYQLNHNNSSNNNSINNSIPTTPKKKKSNLLTVFDEDEIFSDKDIQSKNVYNNVNSNNSNNNNINGSNHIGVDIVEKDPIVDDIVNSQEDKDSFKYKGYSIKRLEFEASSDSNNSNNNSIYKNQNQNHNHNVNIVNKDKIVNNGIVNNNSNNKLNSFTSSTITSTSTTSKTSTLTKQVLDLNFDGLDDGDNDQYTAIYEKSKKEREIKMQEKQRLSQENKQQQKQQQKPKKKEKIIDTDCIPIDEEELAQYNSKRSLSLIKISKPLPNNEPTLKKTRLKFDTDIIDISEDEEQYTGNDSHNNSNINNGDGNNNQTSYRIEPIDLELKWDNVHNQKSKIKPKKNSAQQVIIDFQLVDKNKFGTTYPVPLTQETELVIKLFRQLKGERNEKEEYWRFQIGTYQNMIRELNKLKSQNHCRIQIVEIPKEVFHYLQNPWYIERKKLPKHLQNQHLDEEFFDCTRVPVNLFSTLLPFQLKSLIFCTQQLKGRCLIGDEMGLGKTIQALAIASYYRNEWPLLIVCPSSLRLGWSKEVEKYFPEIAGNISVIMTGEDKADSIVNIISYDLVSRLLEKELLPRKFKTIICDESHYIKSITANRTKKMLQLIQTASKRILLTGTPALSRPIELFPQLLALGAPIYSQQLEFGLRYCDAHKGRYGMDYTGNSHLQELYVLLRGIMIRRLKDDVLRDLPPKHRIKVVVDTPTQMQLSLGNVFNKSNKISMLQQFKQHQQDNNGNVGSGLVKGQVMELYQETGRAKLKSSCEYIQNLIKEKEKFLIFAHHSDIMNGLESAIQKTKANYIRIDGSTPAPLRQNYVSKFQSNQSCQVALLSITAAGTGLTLTASNLVVFVELYWTPGVLRQAEDRVHRIGQTRDVYIHYLIGKNTLDDRIWPIICNKLEVLGETLDGQEEILHTRNIDVRSKNGVNTIDKYFVGKDGAIDLEKEENSDEIIFNLIGDDPDIKIFNSNNSINIDEDDSTEDEEEYNNKKKRQKKNPSKKEMQKSNNQFDQGQQSSIQINSKNYSKNINPNFYDFIKNKKQINDSNNSNQNYNSNNNQNNYSNNSNVNQYHYGQQNNVNINHQNLNGNNNQLNSNGLYNRVLNQENRSSNMNQQFLNKNFINNSNNNHDNHNNSKNTITQYFTPNNNNNNINFNNYPKITQYFTPKQQ